jgi:acylphosphatase
MSEPAVEASLRVVVRGRVQGVGYRDFVYMRAHFLGLRGYVRNLPDMRSVEVVAEGERDSLEQLLDYLREGLRRPRRRPRRHLGRAHPPPHHVWRGVLGYRFRPTKRLVNVPKPANAVRPAQPTTTMAHMGSPRSPTNPPPPPGGSSAGVAVGAAVVGLAGASVGATGVGVATVTQDRSTSCRPEAHSCTGVHIAPLTKKAIVSPTKQGSLAGNFSGTSMA